jgi:hypothetical protein
MKQLLQRGQQHAEQKELAATHRQQPVKSSSAAAAAPASLPAQGKPTVAGILQQALQERQQQQQHEVQQPCQRVSAPDNPTLSELRLLSPLRHTLSTVLSSNLSSLASNSAAMQAVYESGTGCGQNSSSSNGLRSTLGADRNAAAVAVQSGSGSGSSSQQETKPWSLMLQAAGLATGSSNSGGGGSSSTDEGLTPPAESQPATLHSSTIATEHSANTAPQTPASQQQQQQQQQQQLAVHELQHMHMLAERYAAQQQLHAEPSSLSTITERSETRTTPRGLSFTSNFTHDFTVMSGRPSCELHCEVAGRPDSCSSQASSACAFSSYAFSPRQQRQQQQQQQQKDGSQVVAAPQLPSQNCSLSSCQQQAVNSSNNSSSSGSVPAGSSKAEPPAAADQVVAAAAAGLPDMKLAEAAHLVMAAPVEDDQASRFEAVDSSIGCHASVAMPDSPAAISEGEEAVGAAAEAATIEGGNDAIRQQQQAATAAEVYAEEEDAAHCQRYLQQEQQAAQAAMQRLRVQLCSAADRAAAVPSPWGSCDSEGDTDS